MGFTIDNGSGLLSAIGIVLLISAGIIVATWFLAAAWRARRDVLEDDPEHRTPRF